MGGWLGVPTGVSCMVGGWLGVPTGIGCMVDGWLGVVTVLDGDSLAIFVGEGNSSEGDKGSVMTMKGVNAC